MSKFLFKSVLVACLALATVVSCEVSETNEISQPQESVLLRNLSEYNEAVAESQPQTRGFGRFCAIVSADFLGACDGASKGARIGFRVGMLMGGKGLEGAVIGGAVMGLVSGAGASYLAELAASEVDCDVEASLFIDQGKQVRQQYIASSGEEAYSIPEELELPDEAICIGMLHNEILDNVLVADEAPTVSLASFPPDLDSDDDLPELSEMEYAIFESPEVCDTCTYLFDLFSSEGVSLTEDGLAADVAKSFLELIQNYSSSLEESTTHINSYYRYISASDELSEEEKNGLYCGLAVAYYSYMYWNEENE